MLYVYKEGIS